MVNANVTQFSEISNALYWLREKGRNYVAHSSDENKVDFIKALYVADNCCCDENKSKALWEDIGKGVLRYVTENISVPSLDEIVKQLSEKESLIYQGSEKTSPLGKMINQYKTYMVKSKKEAQVVEVAEDKATTEIKNELAVYIEKAKDLTPEEKAERLNALNNAVTINGRCAKKDNQFDFTFQTADGAKYSVKRVHIKVYSGSDVLDRETNRPLISRFKCISEETARQIAAGKGSINIKTSVHQKAQQSKKNEAAQQKAQEKIEELHKAINDEYVRLAAHVSTKRLLLEVAKNGGRLKEDFNFSDESVRQLDLMMMKNIISSENLWGFYTIPLMVRGGEQTQTYYQYAINRASEIRTEDSRWQDVYQKFYDDNKAEENPSVLAKNFRKILESSQFDNDLHLNIRQEIGLKRLFSSMTEGWGLSEQELNGRLKFFNDVLGAVESDKNMQVKVEFEYVPVRHKTTGLTGMRAQAENGGDIILKDMNARVKDPLHKIEALMYRLGELLERRPTVDLTKPSKFRDEEVWNLYQKFEKNGLGSQVQWNDFVQDKHNIETAKNVYQTMKLPEIFGTCTEDYVKWLEREVGTDQHKELPLASNSIHHIVYRRYAGLVSESAEDGTAKFNNVNNLIDTVSLHPLLFDAHKDIEHRFDFGGRFLVRRHGELVGSDFPGIKEGDVLLMPVTKVKRQGEKAFHRLMESGTMMMLADQPIEQPHHAFFEATKPSMWKNKRLLIANMGSNGGFTPMNNLGQ